VTAPLLTLLWTDWQPAWGLDALALSMAAAYLAAARCVSRWPARRTAAFLAGGVAALAGLQSGIGTFDTTRLSVHMIQHLLLIEIVPLMLLAGRPVLLALRAAPRERRPALARRLRALAGLATPTTCLVVYSAVVLGTHVPAVQDATVRHPLLHELEHGSYVAAGILLWWPLLDADPAPVRRLSGLARLVYAMAAMAPMELIGAYLNRASSLVYVVYGGPAHAAVANAIVDQQRAGAIMWAGSGMIMMAVGVWQALAALLAEERRQQARERRLDARLGRG
jgi:cytochrome c oxidase assembly factor CtaG